MIVNDEFERMWIEVPGVCPEELIKGVKILCHYSTSRGLWKYWRMWKSHDVVIAPDVDSFSPPDF